MDREAGGGDRRREERSVEDSVDVTLWLARMIDGKAKCAIVTTSRPTDRRAMNKDSARSVLQTGR